MKTSTLPYGIKQLAIILFFSCFILFSFGQSCPQTGARCAGPDKGSTYYPLNGNGTLGQIYNNTACGLNHVQGSVLIERRSAAYSFNSNGSGLPSSINISGLPPCFVVDKAYLWIIASYTSGSPPNANLNITNPSGGNNGYSFSLIGQHGPKCWAESGTAAYRADVSTNISGNGTYSFNITGFNNGSNEIDGATLMIIYKDNSATYQGSFIINDGIMTSGGANGYPAVMSSTISGFSACANSSYADAFLIVSDMQSNVNSNQHASTLNGSTNYYPNNFYNFDFRTTSVTAGQSSSTFSANGQSIDCYSVAVVGLYYQTTTCTTCTPAALALNVNSNSSQCGFCNGSVTVNPSGGSPPYTYTWSNGQNTQTISSLCSGTYSVVVRDNSGCSSTTSVTISTSPGVTASIPSTTHVLCNGVCNGAATASASGAAAPFSYSWSNGGNTDILTGLCSGSFTVTVTDANNCTGTSTAAITQPNALTASASQKNTFCFGSNSGVASVTASGGTKPYIYSWSNGGATSSVSGLADTTYTVLVTDAHDCVTSASVTLTSMPLPSIAINPSGPNICDGQSTALTASGGVTYAWSPSTGLSSTAGNVVLANPSSSTSYTVIGTDANGCSNSGNALVTVYPLPVITVNPVSPICFGQSTSLTVGGGSTYLWTPSTGLSSTTDSVVTASPPSTITYTVTGTDANGCTNKATATVIVNSLPPVTANPAAPAICLGKTISLTAGGAVSYEWSPATGLSSTTGNVVAANPTSTQAYTVTGTDVNGCTNTATLNLTIYPLPVVSVTSATICSGKSTTLTASGASVYAWSPSTGLSSTNGAVVTATDTGTVQKIYTYNVIGTDANGCSSSTGTTLTINPLPVISIAPFNDLICPGQSITLTASGAIDYTWGPPAGLSSTTGAIVSASPSTLTTYTVTGTDANGCTNTEIKTIILRQLPTITLTPVPAVICYGGSVTLRATSIPACGYTWSPSTGLSSTYGSSITASPTSTTTYTVTTGTGCCINTATLTVTVNPPPPVSVTSASACSGSPVTLSASGASSYVWSPATGLSSTTGAVVTAMRTATVQQTYTYTVIGTDAGGCTNSTTATFTVNPLPVITINPPNNAICPGQSITLTATGAVDYTWSPSTGLSSTIGDVVPASPSVSTVYTVTGTDANGCVNSTSKLVIVSQVPSITLSPIPAEICNGGSIILNASSSPTCDYIWSPSTSLSSTTGSSVTASPTTTTTYTVTTGTGCCINTATITVTVINCIPPPTAIFTSSDTTFCTEAGQCINFFDHSTGSPTSWQWSFPGALTTSSNLQNPSNICYTIPGTYAVSLIVTNSVGTDTIAVTPHIIFGNIPNTPNITVYGQDTLVSSYGASYQWYWNGNVIAGAIDSVYIATQNGTYAVRITDSLGCSSISNGVLIIFTGTSAIPFEKEIKIYPNPVNDQLTIFFSNPLQNDLALSITDVIGQELNQRVLQKGQTVFSLSMSEFSNGIYFLRISNGNVLANKKFIVLHR